MKAVVGIADWYTSDNPEEEIVTYALGSCLGVVVYDSINRIGGILHAMLPFSREDLKKAKEKPAMYVDTGFGVLINDIFEHGAQKKNLKIYVFGGASMGINSKNDHFKIGIRNFTALRKLLWKNAFMIDYKDVGGNISRTVSIRLKDGLVCVNKKPINGQSNFKNNLKECF